MWMGGGGYSLAGSLVELIHQLEAAYPDPAWQNNPQTGTIGNAAHASQGSDSDHNPWLNNTVRAADIASVAAVAHGPDCEAIFTMFNSMYAKHDPRAWPNGYAIYRQRITDWDNPGGWHTYTGDDPHILHCHVSVSQNPAGYNSSAAWPLTGSTQEDDVLNPDDKKWILDTLNYRDERIIGWLSTGQGNALVSGAPKSGWEWVNSPGAVTLNELMDKLNKLGAATPDQIATALAAKLPAGTPADQATVKAALEEFFAEHFQPLPTPPSVDATP